MANQLSIDGLQWPALIAGPPFLCFELGGVPGHKGRHRSRLMIPKDAWTHSRGTSMILKQNVRKIFIQQYPDPDTEAYEKVVAEAGRLFMRGRDPVEGPVALTVRAFRPIPESWSRRDKDKALAGAILPTSRPDGDNYIKVVQDALNGVAWKDDAQVVDARMVKTYSAEPAMWVEAREMVAPAELQG